MKNQDSIYEVWGFDTFANEVYFCKSFDNREDAERYMAKKEADAESKSSCPDLRDRYQIEVKTPVTINNSPRARFRVPLDGWISDED